MAKPHPRHKRALAGLDKQLDTQLSVLEVAKTLHYSASHTRALFRRALGEPFARSQRRRRLDAIAARLAARPEPLTPLAQSTGYASVEALNHAFKARFGRAPSAFAVSPEPTRANPRAIGIGIALARHFALLGNRSNG